MTTTTPETARIAQLADTVVNLGRLALLFGRVDRITLHDDGITAESDTDHTVMLGLVACAIAATHQPDLNIGRVAEFALVHDLVEAYAGDTNTLVGYDAAARADKARREHDAFQRIVAEYADALPWLPTTIDQYEAQYEPEARFVRALDKLLPKVTHLLNGKATLHRQGMTRDQMSRRYAEQVTELAGYAGDFDVVMALRAELVGRLEATD